MLVDKYRSVTPSINNALSMREAWRVMRTGQANIKNVMIYDRLTTATLDIQARTIVAHHRVV